MGPEFLQSYGFPLLFFGFWGWKLFRFQKVKRQIPALLRNGGVIVDVRTRAEYAMGASEGSINIPLNELEASIDRLSVDQPIILCCASGTRSAMAASMLQRKGFKRVVNAGSWKNTASKAVA